MNVDSVIVNYSSWERLYVAKMSSTNKSGIVQRNLLSTLTYTIPKDRNNIYKLYFLCFKYLFNFQLDFYILSKSGCIYLVLINFASQIKH